MLKLTNSKIKIRKKSFKKKNFKILDYQVQKIGFKNMNNKKFIYTIFLRIAINVSANGVIVFPKI